MIHQQDQRYYNVWLIKVERVQGYGVSTHKYSIQIYSPPILLETFARQINKPA